ncbi:MAG TPA: glycosyltransferase, partial [Chthoniobacterales bacterium]|nr:glycosyltransferase [Chthoniobacterales bacterium]
MSQSSSDTAHSDLNSPDRTQVDARIKNLEIENRELKQQIFDHYEWCRQQKEKLITELDCLRSLSIAYRILDFLRRQIERSTGVSRNAFEVQTEKIKLSLVLAPRGSVRGDLLYGLSVQDHRRFEVIMVIDDDYAMLREDSPRIEDLKIVRVSREKSKSARIGLGFGKASGEILGYLDEESELVSSGLRSVASFFQRNPTIQVMHVPAVRETSNGWVLCETPPRIDFLSAWNESVPELSNFFFRRKAFEIVHGVDNRIEGAWEYATILRLLRLYP